MGANDRSYTSGRFAVDVDGFNVGYMKSCSGVGTVDGDIAVNDLGPDKQQKKHLANWKWAPGKMEVGIGMGKGMYDWIKASLDNKHIQKNGVVTMADFDHKAMQSCTWMNGLITEVTCPKLSGDAKDAAYFTIGWEYESARWAKAGGESITAKMGPKQKQWLCSNFSVVIGGLPCARVNTVDSFSWKCTVKSDHVGDKNEYTLHPMKVTVPDLKLTISSADKKEWADFAKKWFIDGERKEDADEMTGRIIYLDPTRKIELGSVELSNVGLKKFSPGDLKGNAEDVSRFTVELYVEQMQFKINTSDA